MNQFLHSRYALVTAALLAAACLFAYYMWGCPIMVTSTAQGFVRGWSGPWLDLGLGGRTIGFAASLLAALLMSSLNRTFNVLRCPSKLEGTLFLCMQVAIPAAMSQLNVGIVLCLTMLLCYFIFFSAFSNHNAQRNVFLAFFLLSLLSTITWLSVVFMLVLWLGVMQMRIFSIRSLLASLMGVATPWIILLGLGIVPIEDLQVPVALHNGALLNAPYISVAIVLAVITGFLGVSAWAQGVMKILSYNAQSRAMISMITVTMLMTLLLMIVDYRSVIALLPLLNCCAAMLTVHLFGVIYNQGKSFWAILSIICIYLVVYTWMLLRCILS